MIQEAEKGKVFLILMILCVWSSAQGAVCLNEVTLCDKGSHILKKLRFYEKLS